VIAVALGWLFAGEPLTVRIALATGLILSAVLLLKAESTRENAAGGEPVCGQPARATASD
jgi:drug/metabolite transporter (DMT)-like permease